MNPDLELALELADIADAITLRQFRSVDLVVETKPDMTPVTEADRAVENAVAERLAQARPDHALVGEEFGTRGRDGASARWIVDPIDGTKNYVRGIPVFATLLALEVDGEVVVGVARRPRSDAAGGRPAAKVPLPMATGSGCRQCRAWRRRCSPTRASRDGPRRTGWRHFSSWSREQGAAEGSATSGST